jgi:hypothetical protein
MVLALAILGSMKKLDMWSAFIPPRYNIKQYNSLVMKAQK